jgi:hypothetical protein
MMIVNEVRNSGSFRDPSGIVFSRNEVIYRQVNKSYEQQFRELNASGLYSSLVEKGWLISHVETDEPFAFENGLLVIKPIRIPFVSYPYEWSFSAYKDAALLTLMIHRHALEHGMVLKDASAYNVQFISGRPVFIDTLSFDTYQEGLPWVAYGQFCRHFIAPLLLMANVDIRLNRMMSTFIDGIPLDLCARLLGRKGGFFSKQHIHWHASSIRKYSDTKNQIEMEKTKQKISLSLKSQLNLIDSMIISLEKIQPAHQNTEWANYTVLTSYSEDGSASKQSIVSRFLADIAPKMVWDLGSNDGAYSLLAESIGATTIAFDADPIAVDRCYVSTRGKNKSILPLLMDLTNPSGDIGFAGTERVSPVKRGRPDCVMMLAVIHHLAISNNVPLELLSDWLHSLSNHLIIEFVPKSDPQVKRLLASRIDIFNEYNQANFESVFSRKWTIIDQSQVLNSERVVYLFESKQ